VGRQKGGHRSATIAVRRRAVTRLKRRSRCLVRGGKCQLGVHCGRLTSGPQAVSRARPDGGCGPGSVYFP
jgi:hypothetical protein